MALYFFNVSGRLPDGEGTAFPHAPDVRREALRMAGEMIRELDGDWDGREWQMQVTDETGQDLLTLCFSAFEGTRPGSPFGTGRS
jgi:hypothetical protein